MSNVNCIRVSISEFSFWNKLFSDVLIYRDAITTWPQACQFAVHVVITVNVHTDCHNGVVSEYRPLLPGEFWQHRTPLHDSEGAIESSRQEGVAAALMSSPPSTAPLPLQLYPPSLQMYTVEWECTYKSKVWYQLWKEQKNIVYYVYFLVTSLLLKV